MRFFEENHKQMQKFKIWQIWEHPLYEMSEYMPLDQEKVKVNKHWVSPLRKWLEFRCPLVNQTTVKGYIYIFQT